MQINTVRIQCTEPNVFLLRKLWTVDVEKKNSCLHLCQLFVYKAK